MPKKRAEIETKSENKQAVYRFIQKHGSATRQELFVSLGLSLPTIKQALAYLESIGLIRAADVVRNTGGRNAAAYSVIESGRTAMGIFLAMNHITAVCVDLSGGITYKKKLPVPLAIRSDEYLQTIASIVEDVIAEAGVDEDKFVGVGITLPGRLSEDSESVASGFTREMTGITRSILSKYISYPTKMFHDSSAAGFAEIWTRPDIDNAVYININSTIGGAVYINNKLYKGNNQRSAEFAHMVLHPENGKPCYCGHSGCFYTVCNADILSSCANGSLDDFFSLLRRGDERIKAVWDTYLDDMALAVHNIRMFYDSEIILGGYVGSYIEEFIDELYRKVDALDVFGHYAREYVLPCKYKNEATAAGCAMQMLERFINNL